MGVFMDYTEDVVCNEYFASQTHACMRNEKWDSFAYFAPMQNACSGDALGRVLDF